MKLNNQYLAGLFDGEGCIRIQRNVWSKGSTKNPIYSLRCSINMTDKKVISMLHNTFGGCLNVSKRPNPNHRTIYNWIMGSQKAYNFLKQIQPYCITKKEEINLAIEFQDHIFECGRKWGKYKPLNKDVISYREIIYSKLISLKTQSI